MSPHPTVTVLMPVHNSSAYLPEAIESVLAQTFGDFELLIIDDGSTDGTWQILTQYARRDARIRLARNQTNVGLTRCLNAGLAQAQGEYIARMDGDDVSLPERLARQVAFMEQHPRVGICGAWVRTTGARGQGMERYPTEDADIRCQLLFKNVLAHPAAIMRRSLFTQIGLAYDPAYRYAQDYDLWVRAAEHVALANIAQILLHYRTHPQQAGQREREAQDHAAGQVRQFQLRRLDVQPTAAESATHEAVSMLRFQPGQAFILSAEAWLRKLDAANQRAGIYSELALARALAERWYMVCRLSTALGPWAWWIFWRSPLTRGARLSGPRALKFGLKCLSRSPSV
ncbi:MAG TPA: glycosyltransferase family 2 protein [Roseiflexaceae bacterium]|nr:glycosyltransferase family 2 protein [Roseiflexaceae bacterium]